MKIKKTVLFGSLFLIFSVMSSQSSAARIVLPLCVDYFKKQPEGRYQVNKQGTVHDTQTGLTWFRCNIGEKVDSNGGCQGRASRFTWTEAQAYAPTAELAGLSGWRVPTVDELKDINETDCRNPSIDSRVFPTIKGDIYWSSEENFWVSVFAWGVFFYNNGDFGRHRKDTPYFLMLVRD